MTISIPRMIAASLLFVAGVVVAISALSIVAARIAIATGVPVRISPADLALLDDLAQLVPFTAAFAAANLVAALALVIGSSWADRFASSLAAAGLGIGVFGVILLTLGNAPFAAVPSNRALSGLEVFGTFAALHGAVIVALALDGRTLVSAPTPAAA